MSSLSQKEIYKYDWRRDLFVKKMKHKEPFELNDGTKLVFDVDLQLMKKIENKKDLSGTLLFVSKNKKVIDTYKLSDLKKNEEFGGGGGSGAGAEQTKLAESAQAIYAQARWNGSTDYTIADIKKAYADSDTNETLEKIISKLSGDWRSSSILGAEKLYEEFKGKQYTFHRGSQWVEILHNHWKTLNRKEQLFSNINKWSPADIYMVSAKGERVDVTKSENIVELNNIMLENITSKDIIGVSLKFMKNSSTLSYYNMGGKKKVVKFESFTTGEQSFFLSKDVYIYFTVDNRVQFRTFPEVFQGEIKGANANQGKLSYGPIQGILRKLKIPNLSDVKVLRSGLENNDVKIYTEFWNNYKKYAKETKKMSLKEFMGECSKKGTSWAFSKFLGCQLIDRISTHERYDDFVTECVAYASSSSDLSGPFVKLE